MNINIVKAFSLGTHVDFTYVSHWLLGPITLWPLRTVLQPDATPPRAKTGRLRCTSTASLICGFSSTVAPELDSICRAFGD